MLKIKDYILFAIFVVLGFNLSAQQDTTLQKEVEVTKAYIPTINGSNRINVMPKLDEKERPAPKFNYSIKSTPILNTFSVNPLKAATIETGIKDVNNNGMIRAGVGNYNKPYGALYFNHLNSRNSMFGLKAEHLSSHGKIKLDGGDKVDAPFSDTDVEMFLKQGFRKNVLHASATFEHDGFRYYGYPVNEIPEILQDEDMSLTYLGDKQAFSKGGVEISLLNPTAEMDDPLFNFDLRYHYFGTKTEQTEHLGEFQAHFRSPFEKGSLVGSAGVNFVYNDGINLAEDDTTRQQTILFVKPGYYIGGKKADITLGFKAWFVLSDQQEALGKITPDVRANYRPLPDKFSLFAGIGGDYINNHYSKMAYSNPFIDPELAVNNSFEKIKLYGGLEGKFSSSTNFKVGVDYSLVNDNPFFYLQEFVYTNPNEDVVPVAIRNTFQTLYDDIALLKFNLEIFHARTEKTDIRLSGNYYSYQMDELEKAWNMPDWDANLSVNVKITDQLSAGTDIYLIGARTAMIEKIPLSGSTTWIPSEEGPGDMQLYSNYKLDTTFDLNVNATYQITQQFSAFARLNNFGFQEYQRWFGYPVQSFNALVGISYVF